MMVNFWWINKMQSWVTYQNQICRPGSRSREIFEVDVESWTLSSKPSFGRLHEFLSPLKASNEHQKSWFALHMMGNRESVWSLGREERSRFNDGEALSIQIFTLNMKTEWSECKDLNAWRLRWIFEIMVLEYYKQKVGRICRMCALDKWSWGSTRESRKGVVRDTIVCAQGETFE